MNVSQFRQVLLDACLITSAVDGDVDESELAVIRDAMTKTLVGEDQIQERIEKLAEVAASFQANTEQRRAGCLDAISNGKLTDGQRRRMIDLCCRVAGADLVLKPTEAEWLRSMINASRISPAEAISQCPQQVAILRVVAGGYETEFAPIVLDSQTTVEDLDGLWKEPE